MRAIILVALLAGAGCVAPPPDPTAQAELHAARGDRGALDERDRPGR